MKNLIVSLFAVFFVVSTAQAATYTPSTHSIKTGQREEVIEATYSITAGLGIGAGAGTVHKLDLPSNTGCGKIWAYHVASGSDDLDISVFDLATGTAGTDNEIIDKDSINLSYFREGMSLFFCNKDGPQDNALYFQADNTGGSTATGYISATFYITKGK